MIDVKELRIGNWISTYNETDIRVTYCQVTALDLELISTTDGFGSYNGYSGILLTPEILEKAGFELDGIGHHIRLHDRFNKYRFLSLAYNNDDAIPKYYTYYRQYNSGNPNDRCEDNIVQVRHDLQYLHQLQNLYFSLTQTELNIQL